MHLTIYSDVLLILFFLLKIINKQATFQTIIPYIIFLFCHIRHGYIYLCHMCERGHVILQYGLIDFYSTFILKDLLQDMAIYIFNNFH